MIKRFVATVSAVVLIATGLTVASVVHEESPARALSGADFDPGNIISDSVFFNGAAMTESDVQSFLDRNIGSCRNGNCLNVKTLPTATRAADAMCGTYAGAASERVSRIIVKVAQACGINPQVLLVTLQKEQSLVSGDIARGPSDARLERAMGYACPDTANGGCDPSFAGVYNQLYKAAWQFKRYANPAGTSNFFTWFRPGTTAAVQYSPNAACGTRSVTIRNQATANLYYYTPYTPNAAALASLNGTGDACSAYGNRNFWVYFNNWFGSTQGDTKPVGALDQVTASQEQVTVRGWAFDRGSADSIQVHVYVGGRGTPALADRSRPDVAAAHPGKGAAHGFEVTVPAPAGNQQVCVYAIGLGGNGNSTLGCSTVVVATASPIGNLELVEAAPGGFLVRGWALDADDARSIQVHVYVDATPTAVTADLRRDDVAASYPNWGPSHGFETRVSAGAGPHRVCAYGINVGRGSNALIGCATTTALGSVPIGNFESAVGTSAGVQVRGWALDGDNADPTQVHVYVDGVGRPLVADGAREDVGRTYPSYGARHGFSATVPAAPGTHRVCAYAINLGPGSVNTTLGCRDVTVPGTVPVGNFERAAGVAGAIEVAGWALEPGQTSPLTVQASVDGGAPVALTADRARNDVAVAFPGSGAAHGFSTAIAAPAGRRTVCLVTQAVTTQALVDLGCRTVDVR